MAFRRFQSIGSPSSLLASLPRLRNQLVAERERLAAEERRLAKQIDNLRSRQDDLSNRLHQPQNPSLREVRDMMTEEAAQRPIEPSKVAAFVLRAGELARGRVPPPLPPKGSVARFVVLAGMKARNEKIPDDAE
jgi:hypothetical protein